VARNAFTIDAPAPAMTPRNALMYPEPQPGEVTPSQAAAPTPPPFTAVTVEDLGRAAQSIQDDIQPFRYEPGKPLLNYFVDPATGELTPSAQRGVDLTSGFVGSSGGPGLRQLAGSGGNRISTRVPTAVAEGDAGHFTDANTVGIDSSKASGPAYDKNAEILRKYPGLKVPEGADSDTVVKTFVDHVKDNLLWLHDQMPEAIRGRSQQWYDGANRIANEWSEQYGLHPRQVAGAIAALSPQRDWFQNVSLAKRLLDIRHLQADTAMTPEMEAWGQSYIDRMPNRTSAAARQTQFDTLRGRTLGDLDNVPDRAMWSRFYDEAHNSKDFHIVTPEGEITANPVMTAGTPEQTLKSGKVKAAIPPRPQQMGWGSFEQIENSLGALEAQDLPTISRLMGGQHKVRNFYNNIIEPSHPADVTIDTHAIAGGMLHPWGSSAPEVSQGLGIGGGASESAATGSKGLYGLYAEAYRQAAKARNILPRQMQSITWEGIRGLFSPAQKNNQGFRDAIASIWKRHQDGELSADQAREAIRTHAGGMDPPDWHAPDAAPHD
jgi:hypothetical protein